MNWIPEMMKRAAKYGGDLDHPEVVAWAHEQWQKQPTSGVMKSTVNTVSARKLN